ncbi:MAG: hypothetical protein ACI4K6_04975 [Candidatus Fimenecus sp.]
MDKSEKTLVCSLNCYVTSVGFDFDIEGIENIDKTMPNLFQKVLSFAESGELIEACRKDVLRAQFLPTSEVIS